MTSKDHYSGSDDKTIARLNPGHAPKPDPAAGARQDAVTVFDPAVVEHAPAGWASGPANDQGPAVGDDSAAHSGAAELGPADPRLRTSADPARKLAQDELLEARGDVKYCATNPIIAAAGPLLMLLGRLRLMVTETQPAPLAEHVADAIQKFEQRIAAAEVSAEDARIAKFVLCETADDIIRNLPGADRDAWVQCAMLSRFFQTGVSGKGFFTALNKILADPGPHCDLLELMHVCLSLGFEGQYRGIAQDGHNLDRVRRDVYETLRYFRAHAPDDVSLRWQGLAETMPRRSARLPFWSIAAAALALATGCFAVLRAVVSAEGDALSEKLLALNPATPVTIERAEAPAFVPLTQDRRSVTQLERIRASLADEMAAGALTVEPKGDFIVVEINNLILFEPGKADVKPEFERIASGIAAALQPEPGPIRIVGHTDNVKPRKSSAFKSNYDLSVARAKAVEKMIAPKIGDPSRIAAEGKGEDDPLADNGTAEGRAKNRRVDLMILREEKL